MGLRKVAIGAGALLGVGYLGTVLLIRFNEQGKNAFKPIADAISGAIDYVTPKNYVKGAFGFVVLNRKDFNDSWLFKPGVRDAIAVMHKDNPSLLAKVISINGTLMPQYRDSLNAGLTLFVEHDEITIE